MQDGLPRTTNADYYVIRPTTRGPKRFEAFWHSPTSGKERPSGVVRETREIVREAMRIQFGAVEYNPRERR